MPYKIQDGLPVYVAGNRGPKPRPLEDRFCEKLDVDGGDDACWPWTGKRLPTGYGVLSNGHENYIYAHRLAYMLMAGPVYDHELVLHRCDNPPCCNPKHLFKGDDADNAADKVQKGRQTRGKTVPQAKLTDAAAETIRKQYAAGATQKDLAAVYGVGAASISRLVQRKTWKHVAGDTPADSALRRAKGEAAGNARLTNCAVLDIRARLAAGERIAPIAAEYGVSVSLISHIRTRRIWKHI